MVNLPEINGSEIERHKVFMLFETRFYDSRNFKSYVFIDPVKVIRANSLRQVREAFNDIEIYSRDCYVAGYFAYELGYYLEDEIFSPVRESDTPLLCLGIFRKKLFFDHSSGKNNIDTTGLFSKNYAGRNFSVHNLRLDVSARDYRSKISRIKGLIKKGQTYQVNLTAKYKFNFLGSAFDFYNKLASCQKVQYSAFLKMGGEQVLSFSPELFFRRERDYFYSEPMKGTISRGESLKEDTGNLKMLKISLKDRAENLMIVDLMRNDLGRVCETGSVKVSGLFKIRRYKTIFQMTSGIEGRLKKDVSYLSIFKNIFPGGSVTGAPKIRTMEIIKSLEKDKRGVYCGALGFISPRKEAVFNLPIRTVHINGKAGVMGVGSGIVQDSSAREELRECRLKARFFMEAASDFGLVETIAWDKGYGFIREHFLRMQQSARYFGFVFRKEIILAKLFTLEKKFSEGRLYKIRIILDRKGGLIFEYDSVKNNEDGIKHVAVSQYRTDPKDIFLYHKTTNRGIYNAELKHYGSRGYSDVIFINTRNEFTEGAISNIIIQKKNEFYTPPVSSGLLAGVYRRYLLENKLVREKKLYWRDIIGADKIFLCNCVRRLTEVRLKGVYPRGDF